MQVLDLITMAARKFVGVASGESLAAEEQTDWLNTLNLLLDSLNAERIAVYSLVQVPVPVAANRTTPYTIGPSAADVNTTRPTRVVSAQASVTSGASSGLSAPLEVVNAKKWLAIPEPTTTRALLPRTVYYDRAFPIGNLYLTPIPTVALSVALNVWQQLTAFVAVTDTVNLPPGYARMLVWNLAVELAPELGREASQTMIAMAQQSKAAIAGLNASETEDGAPAAIPDASPSPAPQLPTQPAQG